MRDVSAGLEGATRLTQGGFLGIGYRATLGLEGDSDVEKD